MPCEKLPALVRVCRWSRAKELISQKQREKALREREEAKKTEKERRVMGQQLSQVGRWCGHTCVVITASSGHFLEYPGVLVYYVFVVA